MIGKVLDMRIILGFLLTGQMQTQPQLKLGKATPQLQIIAMGEA